VDTLADESATFTVFAPTDAAFAKIPSDVLTSLLGNTEALRGVLLQHVIGDAEVSSLGAYAANGASVDTLSGNDVTVRLVNFTQAANDDSTEVAYDAVNQRLVGGNGSAKPGFTLYVFDNDLGSAGSNCNDQCATNWPPVLVTDGDVSAVPGLSVIERADNTLQAAYQGRPLYFFVNDAAAGDANGNGVNSVWWQVSQEQVSLQIQGANVVTKDIYTTNGVIHVIDTVITETLE
jgi:predicted lipoprotein with Yx(FWY)xxD motif